MKTIKEINKEREGLEPSYFVVKVEYRWRQSGIECPCGCKEELLFLLADWPVDHKNIQRIKCPNSGKLDNLYYDGSIKLLITKIEWDEK